MHDAADFAPTCSTRADDTTGRAFDPVGAVLARLAGDRHLNPTLRRAFEKQAPRRFTGEPITDFGSFHDYDSREQEWAEEQRRDAAAERNEQIERLSPWSRA